MFNSFHHFAESDAKQILQSAVEAAQPIAIFEYPQRNALIILLTFVLTPLLVALAAPFIRPFRCSRLVFTYLLPVIPLTCWWDGIVSHLRAYTAEELQRLAEYADGGGSFVWCAGRILVPYLPAHLTFLVGHPIGNGNCEIQARKASMRLRWHASALPQLILRALRQTLGIPVRDFSHARKRMPRSELGCNFTRASQFCAGRCESR